MNIIKMPTPKLTSFEIDTPNGKKTLPGLGIGNSAGQVIANLTQSTLCELKERLELFDKVHKGGGKRNSYEYQYSVKFGQDLTNPGKHDELWENSTEEERLLNFIVAPYEQQVHDDLIMCFTDLVVVQLYAPGPDEDKFTFYKTEEVLEVVKQWIEYLEKFYAEYPRD